MGFRIQGRVDRPWRFFSIAIVFVVGALFYSDWRAFQRASLRADQTRLLLQQTDAVLSSIKDAETAERGYLLTGDRKYLDPWPAAERAIPVELDALTRSAATVSPRNVPQIERIRTLAREKIAQIHQTIDARDHDGLDAALAIVRTDEGKLTMDELRSTCALLVSGEYYSLYQETSAAQLLSSRSRIVVLVGCLGLVVLLFRLGTAVDSVVRERELIAKGAEEARQLLETTLASIADAVIVTDADGAIRFINRVAQRLTGWPASEAEGEHLEQVFPVFRSDLKVRPDGLEKPVDVIAGGLVSSGNAAIAGSLALKSRNGHRLPIEHSVAPIKDRRGKTLGTVVVFRDVSARRRAERELERWKQIFSGAGFGMFVIDPENQSLLDMNPTFAAMHGYTVDELRGTPLSALATQEYRAEMGSILNIAAEKGRHMFEQRHARKDGSLFPVLLDLTTFDAPTHDGKSWWAGYCSDITERKRFEDELRESEERFRTLASALPQLIWSTDARGHLEYANPVWVQYAGPPKQYVEDPWSDFLHPDDRMEFFRRWKHSLSSGDTFEMQARMRRVQDSTYRWFICRGVAIRDREGNITRWLGGCTDVQEQVEGAIQLKVANESLERSNSDLEQFAYAASHDLQEPLRMVSIYTQLLREEYGTALDDQALSWIDFAVNGAQRMGNLLKALLAYSRVANITVDTLPPSDSEAAVRAALLNLRSVIDESHADITADWLPNVRVPEIHMVQLFQNLIGNAVKYRQRHGIGTGRPEIHINAQPHGRGQWMFSVRDNGVGIEPEFLTHIFGVFKRLHGQEVEGTGIGLALCQKIVERAGGRIWVESEVGRGSTFYFTLPVAAEVDAATAGVFDD